MKGQGNRREGVGDALYFFAGDGNRKGKGAY